MKRLTLLVLIVVSGNPLWAQDYEVMQSAFSKSYDLEKEGKYREALTAIEELYKADSYDFNIRCGWLKYYLGEHPKSAG